MLLRRTWAVIGLVLALIAGACGGGDDASDTTASPSTTAPSSGDTTPATTAAAPGTTAAAPATTPAPSTGGGGGAGQLVMDAETIVLDRALCYLQEQDAAGGGKILFTAQATGVNADGNDVLIDWTRFDEDTQFAGDDVLINIGADEFSSNTDIGTITVEGSAVSSPELTFTVFKDNDMIEIPGSFQINC